MGFILLLLFVAILFLLCMLALIFTAAASVMGRERPMHLEEPTCGGCGYIVKNVEEPVCSTCHAEFIHVGIVMPPPPASNSAAAAWLAFRRVSGVSLGIWTIVAGMVSLGLTVWCGEHLLPYTSESLTHLEVRPKSTGYDSVLMTITHRRRARGRLEQEEPTNLVRTVVIDLKTARGTRTLKADLLAPTLSYINGQGKTIESVAVPSEDLLVDFMKAGGVTIDAQAKMEANAIAKLVNDPSAIADFAGDHSANGDLPVEIISNNVDGGAWEPAMPLAFLVIPSAVFFWLFGVGVISFIQRGKRAALRAQILNSTAPVEIPWEFTTPAERDVVAVATAKEAASKAAAAAKEAGPAPAGGSSVPPATTDPAKAA